MQPERPARRFLFASHRPAAVELIFFMLAAGAVTVAGYSLPTNHDEAQYIAAAHLTDHLLIYKEFFYSQTPYFVYLLGWWTKLSDICGINAYLSARTFNIAWSLMFVATLYATLRLISRNIFLSLLLTTCVLLCEFLDLPLRVARNDMMPLALATAALLSVVLSLNRRAAWQIGGLHFAAGLLVALAVGAKQSYAFVAVAFAVYAVLAPHLPLRSRYSLTIGPLVCGGFLGALPMFALVVPNFANFWYSAFTFHSQSHALFVAGGPPEMHQRFIVLARRLWEPYVLAIVGIGFGYIYLAHPPLKNLARVGKAGEVSVLALCGAAVLFIATSCLLAAPLHRQYVAPLMPFLACGSATLVRLSERLSERQARPWAEPLMAAAVLAGLLGIGFLQDHGLLAHLRTMAFTNIHPEAVYINRVVGEPKWAGPHLTEVRTELHAILGGPDRDLKIATLMPQYAVDAGFGIYPELAGAPFFYRGNDHLDDKVLRQLRGTSPARVAGWLAENEADVILVGYRPSYGPDLEAGFVQYATSRNMACFQLNLRGAYAANEGRLFVAKNIARTAPDC